MSLGAATFLRNEWLTSFATALDSGTGPGLIWLYDGNRPVVAGGATTLLLAEFVLSKPAFQSSGAGQMLGQPVNIDASANNDGLATWFRMTNSEGLFVVDGDVATAGGDMNLTSTTIVQGIPVEITNMLFKI